jgi:hypothetical protein
MIDPTIEPDFPNNVVHALSIVLPGIDPDLNVFKRPLRPSDPHFSLSIYGTLWTPDENSFEIGAKNAGPNEPTLSTYQIGIQTLVKDGDSTRGLAISSILAKRVRMVLYRNEPLRVALGSLYVEGDNFRESLRRWGARSQRYMSNDIEGTFVTISVLDLWIETEMT